MFRFSAVLIVAVTCVPPDVRATPLSGAPPRPNVIFLMTDDHASHAISAYGSRINRTPHLDRLAAEGRLFTNCFVTNSICAPSRATILTGKYSHRNGVLDNRLPFDGSQTTFPKLLQAAGYQTAFVGKWHLKTDPTGFDHWEILPGQGTYYNPRLKTKGGEQQLVGYTTDILTDRAIDWLQSQRESEKPFLLCLQHKAPHREWAPGPDHLTTYDDTTIPEPETLFDDWSGRASPASRQTMSIRDHLSQRDLKLVPPGNLTEEQLATWNAAYGPKNLAFEEASLTGRDLVRWKYQRYIKDYLRCVASVDDGIGRVLDYLDESGLSENTIVVYTSDQGFYLGDHGWYDKRWMYEESLRTPLIVRWPGITPQGSKDDHLVMNLDFAQTILEAAGVEAPTDMQGESLVPLLRGESPSDWRDAIYYHYYEFPAVHSVRRHCGVRTDRFKLIHYYQEGEWELFDLRADPNEMKSVHAHADYAEVRAGLEARLEELRVKYGDTEDAETVIFRRSQQALRERAAGVELELAFRAEAAGAETPELDPSAKPWTIGAFVQATNGVVLALGGESTGLSLHLREGHPVLSVREDRRLFEVVSPVPIPNGAHAHVAGRLDADGRISILVDGRLMAQARGALLSSRPYESRLDIGRDEQTAVGAYEGPNTLDGEVTDARVYWGRPDKEELRAWRGDRD
ncbi:MAG: sulfatase-like hydrolase/transferase [Planctomycetota bacterium]